MVPCNGIAADLPFTGHMIHSLAYDEILATEETQDRDSDSGTLFFSNLSQREILSEIKPPLQNQLCMQRRIFQENNPLLSQNTKSQSDDDFLGCCPSPVYLILGSSWDPLVPDPAFDRHFPSYWMDKCKTSSMIAKCGKIFCSNFVQGFYFKILI